MSFYAIYNVMQYIVCHVSLIIITVISICILYSVRCSCQSSINKHDLVTQQSVTLTTWSQQAVTLTHYSPSIITYELNIAGHIRLMVNFKIQRNILVVWIVEY